MILVHVGELFSFSRSIVSTIIESVSLPGSVGEFGPFDVVFEQLAAFGVHYVDFRPVGAASRDGVRGVFAVV